MCIRYMHICIANSFLVSRDRDLPYTDGVVGVTGEQGLAIGGPGQGQTLGLVGLGTVGNNIGAEFFDGLLAGQIPDLDGWTIGNAQPVAVGGEAQGIDDVVVFQGVQVLAVIQVPQESLGVLATRCAEGTVRRNGDGVQVTVVTVVVVLQLAVSQVPDLDGTIPAAGNNDGVGVVGGEADARYPIGVAIFLDGELAFGQGVPQLDGLVTGARNDLTIVSRESNRQNILSVIFETASGLASGQIPQAQGLVPGTGQSVVTIGGQNDVTDEVRVTIQTLLGETVVGVFVTGQLPDNQGLVTRSRDDGIGILGVGGDLGYPAIVTQKGTA